MRSRAKLTPMQASRANNWQLTICGVAISPVGPQEAVDQMLRSKFGVPREVHLCNAYTLSLALRSETLRALLNRNAVNFADGYPVAALGRRAGHDRMIERVYGPDLMAATLDRG